MNEIDLEVMQAAKLKEQKNYFIKKNEYFVLKCASSAIHRFISRSDDEWSVALWAFSEAIDRYSVDKGGFYPFAELVIRRKLIDHLRIISKTNAEILIDPALMNADIALNENERLLQNEITSKLKLDFDKPIQYEIEAANQIFKTYGFTFYDLSKCSPKAEKTKTICRKAITGILSDRNLIFYIKKNKILPIKTLEKNWSLPRKILERHRKYIIAACEILSGEYPFLSEYVRSMREEYQ